MYVLADRRFAVHFGRESNREGIPHTMVAEIDMAQDQAEVPENELCTKVELFLNQDFGSYDADLEGYLREVPVPKSATKMLDTSAEEVLGWTKLFASQNYDLAADDFQKCFDVHKKANLIEIAAFWKWHQAKALHLSSLLGNVTAGTKSLELLDEAIKRGGVSSWFNRLRASLNRARGGKVATAVVGEYAEALIRSFDDHLERLGTKGDRFEIFFFLGGINI